MTAEKMTAVGNHLVAIDRMIGKLVTEGEKRTNTTGFAEGYRVIVRDTETGYLSMDGHYGFVTKVVMGPPYDLVYVRMTGCISGAVNPSVTGVEWPFFPSELNHAD